MLYPVWKQPYNMHHTQYTVLLIFFRRKLMSILWGLNRHCFTYITLHWCCAILYTYGDIESPEHKLQEGRDIDIIVCYYVPKIYNQ